MAPVDSDLFAKARGMLATIEKYQRSLDQDGVKIQADLKKALQTNDKVFAEQVLNRAITWARNTPLATEVARINEQRSAPPAPQRQSLDITGREPNLVVFQNMQHFARRAGRGLHDIAEPGVAALPVSGSDPKLK